MVLASIIHWVFAIYSMLLLVRILSSWFPELDQFIIIQVIKKLTEPYLTFFRNLIPPLGAIDVSPIIAFFFLRILEGCIMGILY